MKIAAITMVRNDELFLRKWVEYYGRELGRDKLYVLFDGEDQTVPDFCEDVNVEILPRTEGKVSVSDHGRMDKINGRAGRLFDEYDAVIGVDVDEFLVPDPLCGKTLSQFIEEAETRHICLSGLGIDVGQKLEEELPINWDKPFLSQRSYAKLSTRYSKPSVLLSKARWGSGFHRVKGHNFHIVKDLYLFHFGCVDYDLLKSKMSDTDKLAAGWSRHMKKRAGTIRLVSRKKAHGWTRSVKLARMVQNIFRPPYALNKPAMFEVKAAVRIPERFANVI